MVLSWFLSLDYFTIFLIMSIIVALITTIIYKYATDQKKLKGIKEDLKKLREKMKKHKDNPDKVMSINKEMMSLNFEMMKQSFRSMLFTFIPLILILSWMAGNLAFEPLRPGEDFSVTAFLSDSYPGDAGDVSLNVMPEGSAESLLVDAVDGSVHWIVTPLREGSMTLLFEGETFRHTKEIIVTEEKKYESPTQDYRESHLTRVVVDHDSVRPFGDVSLFGWRPGWLGAYILLTLVFSLLLRKILKVA